MKEEKGTEEVSTMQGMQIAVFEKACFPAPRRKIRGK